jgi:hypothetical protein
MKKEKRFDMADGRVLVADWDQNERMVFKNVFSIHYVGEPSGVAAKRAFFTNNDNPGGIYDKVAGIAEDEAKNSWIQKEIRGREEIAQGRFE